jgi:hypothetical protein
MNNFKDYLNFSSNLSDNLYRLRLIALTEAKKKKEKKANKDKANKDYDGDGEIESGTEEYLGSRKKAIKKAIDKKNQNKLSESKEKMPTEMMAGFFVNNSTEGSEPEDAEMYTPLPSEIHKQILPHVENAVLMIGQGGRIPEDANLPKHINDLSKAIGILDKAGHGNHPAAHFLDRIRDTINDEHMSRRR